MPKTLEGLLTDRVDTGPEERKDQLSAGFGDYRTRLTLIADREFR